MRLDSPNDLGQYCTPLPPHCALFELSNFPEYSVLTWRYHVWVRRLSILDNTHPYCREAGGTRPLAR